MCTHTTTRIDWTTQRCYTGSVYSADPNPAAAGGIEYVEQCCECGRERWVAANGAHHEYGRWGESRAALAARAKEQSRRDEIAAELAAARAAGVTAVASDGDVYEVRRGGTITRAHAADIAAACCQSDTATAMIYRGVRRMASR